MNPDAPALRLTPMANRRPRGDSMTVRSLMAQFAVRMMLVAGLAGIAGATAYSATHWEPNMGHGSSSSSSAAAVATGDPPD
jgi:hypothetical protein